MSQNAQTGPRLPPAGSPTGTGKPAGAEDLGGYPLEVAASSNGTSNDTGGTVPREPSPPPAQAA